MISRRAILASFAATAAMLPARRILAQANQKSTSSANRRRIDVHHHMLPPVIDLWKNPRSFPNYPVGFNWSPEVSLEAMDKYGTETAVLSVTGLGPSYADLYYDGTDRARGLVRQMNEFGAKAMSDHPKRFGFFACLPVPNQDAALKEIEYAFDTLKADGVMFFSSIGDQHPGDPVFLPVFEELNRRKAVVFFHPTVPHCCRNATAGVPDTTAEFDFDTTRAILSLLFNGVIARCPDIRFIVNHSGAAVPVLSGRIKDIARGDRAKFIPGGSAGALDEMRKLYFECAHATYAAPIAAVTKFAPPTQLLFGTDFPVWPYTTTIDPFNETEPELPADVQHAMDRGNAERLFPRLKA